MALALADLRKYVTSPLADADLQRLLDYEYAAITQWIGDDGAVTDMLAGTRGPLLALNRPALTITSVTDNLILLDPLDYQLRPSGGVLERLRTGPNPLGYWRGRIDVVYTPRPINRDLVAMDLVKLDLAHNPGVVGEQIGDYQVQFAPKSGGALNYDEERESILQTLMLDQVGIF